MAVAVGSSTRVEAKQGILSAEWGKLVTQVQELRCFSL